MVQERMPGLDLLTDLPSESGLLFLVKYLYFFVFYFRDQFFPSVCIHIAAGDSIG
jgi:hypothetical protein